MRRTRKKKREEKQRRKEREKLREKERGKRVDCVYGWKYVSWQPRKAKKEGDLRKR